MGVPLVDGYRDTWDGFWYVVLAEQFRGDLVDPFGDLGRKAADLAKVAGDQLGILAVAAPAAFLLVAFRRPRFALLTVTWLLVICWFAASYTNAAIDRYYLGPALIVITWLALRPGFSSRRSCPPRKGAAAWGGARPRGRPGRCAHSPGGPGCSRDCLAGRHVPTTHGRRSGAAGLAAMGTDAVVVSWWSFSTLLWYRTVVLGERPDVQVVDDRDRLDEGLGSVDDVIRANVGARPVFLVRHPAEINALQETWILEIVPDPGGIQPLYRVIGPQSAR